MSKKKTGNDDYGRWTYHEYENADGGRGYIISGGLLPDDDAVNRKARELGHDINRQAWVRTEKMEGGSVRYFYRGGAIGDELIEDESKEIGPFYDLPEHNYLFDKMLVSESIFMSSTLILGVIDSEYATLVLIAAMVGAVSMFAVGCADSPGRRVIDSMGAAITNPEGTPVRVRLSSAMRRLLRRCHARVDAAPDGWSRIKRNGEVAYIHEHAGTATFVTRDDAIDLVTHQIREFNSVPTSSSRLIDKSDLVETSASTVVNALRNVAGPSVIPASASTLDVEQSRVVMARLRARVPER